MINFDNAMTAHMSWKMRLRKFVNSDSEEKLDVAVVRQDNQCELGKWIYGDGTKYSTSEEYKRLKSIHAEFHKNAARVLEMHSKGDNTGANAMLTDIGSDYSRCSGDCIKAIKALQTFIGSSK